MATKWIPMTVATTAAWLDAVTALPKVASRNVTMVTSQIPMFVSATAQQPAAAMALHRQWWKPAMMAIKSQRPVPMATRPAVFVMNGARM